MEEKLQSILENYTIDKGSLIGLLQDIQEAYGYLPEEKLEEVSQALDVPISRLFSLATFYTSFRLEPIGKHHVCVCVGTACHVRGAAAIVETLERELHIVSGETTKDMQFTVDTVNCLGACALAPLVVVDDQYHGKMAQQNVKKLLKKYQEQDGSEKGG